MLEFLYKIRNYLNIKSGLLLDYYVKTVAILLITQLYVYINLFYADKFFIEYCTLNFFRNYERVLNLLHFFRQSSMLQIFTIILYIYILLFSIIVICIFI